MTPEERRSIFSEVQSRSAKKKESRRKGSMKMAKSLSDSVTLTEPDTNAKPMATGTPVVKKESLRDIVKRRNRRLEEIMK